MGCCKALQRGRSGIRKGHKHCGRSVIQHQQRLTPVFIQARLDDHNEITCELLDSLTPLQIELYPTVLS